MFLLYLLFILFMLKWDKQYFNKSMYFNDQHSCDIKKIPYLPSVRSWECVSCFFLTVTVIRTTAEREKQQLWSQFAETSCRDAGKTTLDAPGRWRDALVFIWLFLWRFHFGFPGNTSILFVLGNSYWFQSDSDSKQWPNVSLTIVLLGLNQQLWFS